MNPAPAMLHHSECMALLVLNPALLEPCRPPGPGERAGRTGRRAVRLAEASVLLGRGQTHKAFR